MANLNRIILVGRLTADPEMRFAVDGLPVGKFCLAVDRFGEKQPADLINVVVWRKLAEICGQYLIKGQLVLVEGRIQIRTYDDQNGKRKWVTEVVAGNVKMLSRGKGKTQDAAPPVIEDASVAQAFAAAENAPAAHDEFEEFSQAGDDLPF